METQRFHLRGERRSAAIVRRHLESKGNVSGLVGAPHCSCLYGSDCVIPGCQMSLSSFGRGDGLSVLKIQEIRRCDIQMPSPLNHLPATTAV